MGFISRPTQEQREQEALDREQQRQAQERAKLVQWEAQYHTHPAKVSVPTWEYKSYFFGTGTQQDHVERALNVLGHQGWELVSLDVERNQRIMGAPAQTTIVLKRRTS